MMKRMKRWFAALIVCCLSLSLGPAAGAAEAYGEDPGSAAQFLNQLGLFQGTGSGFELDRIPTRQEGVTLLVRLLGKEAEAKAGAWTTPFTDVDAWAAPYVGYAFQEGLTQGVSATAFGASNTLTGDQYATFLLRALGYESGADFQWDSAGSYAAGLGLPAVIGSFTRGSAAVLSRAALDTKQKDGAQTLGEALILQGVFTAQAFQSAKTDEASGALAALARANESTSAQKADTYTIKGVTFTIEFPDEWKKLCTIESDPDTLSVTNPRNASSGGGIFYITVVTAEELNEMGAPCDEIVKVPGGILVAIYAQDVQWNYDDPGCSEEYLRIFDQRRTVLDSIKILP